MKDGADFLWAINAPSSANERLAVATLSPRTQAVNGVASLWLAIKHYADSVEPKPAGEMEMHP